jgi:hypothetical protein
VAYVNGSATSTTALGTDADGTNWQTVGYWAGLRGASPLATDDGKNFLRIAHPTPVGIKYWEVGNELYGNGFYYGGEGWEEDLHLAHNGTVRTKNAALSPTAYGTGFATFAKAMKAVDSTVKVGVIVHWPYNEYADWNAAVLAGACADMDFGVNHWYAGTTIVDLLARPRTDIPNMMSQLHATLAASCPAKGMTLPIAVTEWGPNTQPAELKADLVTAVPPIHTQAVGLFAADAYANFMEQGFLAVHWLELHNDSYLGYGATDVPVWGYKGQVLANHLANAGDMMVAAPVSNDGALGALFQAHAAKHADGSVSVMLVNTSPATAAAANVTVSGGSTLNCVGTAYTYKPLNVDDDGPITSAPIFSKTNAVPVLVPAYSVVVIVFPKA